MFDSVSTTLSPNIASNRHKDTVLDAQSWDGWSEPDITVTAVVTATHYVCPCESHLVPTTVAPPLDLSGGRSILLDGMIATFDRNDPRKSWTASSANGNDGSSSWGEWLALSLRPSTSTTSTSFARTVTTTSLSPTTTKSSSSSTTASSSAAIATSTSSSSWSEKTSTSSTTTSSTTTPSTTTSSSSTTIASTSTSSSSTTATSSSTTTPSSSSSTTISSTTTTSSSTTTSSLVRCPTATFTISSSNSLPDGSTLAIQGSAGDSQYSSFGSALAATQFHMSVTCQLINNDGQIANIDGGSTDGPLFFNTKDPITSRNYQMCGCHIDASSVLTCACGPATVFSLDSQGNVYTAPPGSPISGNSPVTLNVNLT